MKCKRKVGEDKKRADDIELQVNNRSAKMKLGENDNRAQLHIRSPELKQIRNINSDP